MALVVLGSAKGAPGVTTLTVALAALSPGAVAADLDPDGGDLVLRYRRDDGAPLDPDQGLLSLAASLRIDPDDFVGAGPIDSHLQVTSGGLEVLLGVRGPDQAVGLGPLWSPLARALAGAGRPVFADCGRIGPSSPAMPVLMVADAVILVARAELEELSHLRERLHFLTATLPSRYSGRAQVGVILVAPERDRAAGPRTEQLLRSSGIAVPVLGTIAHDSRGAAKLRGLGSGRAGRTTLVRSVRSLLPAVRVFAGDVPEVALLRGEPELIPELIPEPISEPAPEPVPLPRFEAQDVPVDAVAPADAAWGAPFEPAVRTVPTRRDLRAVRDLPQPQELPPARTTPTTQTTPGPTGQPALGWPGAPNTQDLPLMHLIAKRPDQPDGSAEADQHEQPDVPVAAGGPQNESD
jgi:hypothetical protein